MNRKIRRLLTSALALSALAAAGCSDKSETALGPTSGETAASAECVSCQTEQAFPGATGEVKQGYFRGLPITYQVIDGKNVLEGDIVVPDELITASSGLSKESSTGRTAVSALWPNSIVYYTVDAVLPDQARVTNAIANWETNTNLRFVLRTAQPSFVTFRVGTGCASNVGRTGGQQFVDLAGGCTQGNAIHEIGHTVGLWHEHTRADRNTRVRVNTANIQAGTETNFQRYTDLGFDGYDHAAGFDFGSVMLYGSFAFSRFPNDGNPLHATIVRLDGSLNGAIFDGQRNGLSGIDAQGVNNMYTTTARTWTATTTLPGNLGADVGVGGTATAPVVFAVAGTLPNGTLVKRVNGTAGWTWAAIPGGATAVDVDQSGTPFIIRSDMRVYKGTGSGTSYTWTQLAAVPGGAQDIGVSPNGTLFAAGRVIVNGLATQKLYKLVNNAWVAQPIPPNGPIKLTADHNGRVWFIDKNGGVWTQSDNGWFPIVGYTVAASASDISAGADGTVMLRSNSEVRVFNGKGKFNAIAGTLSPRSIDVDASGNPWVVQADGKVFN